MSDTLWEFVRQRADGLCEYCRMPAEFDPIPFEIDHIVALKHRGATVDQNLGLSCFSCNSYKGSDIAGLDPIDGQLTRLYHPRRDLWDDHFELDGARIEGRSAEGRTTATLLRMNSIDRVAFRRELIDEGVFPSV